MTGVNLGTCLERAIKLQQANAKTITRLSIEWRKSLCQTKMHGLGCSVKTRHQFGIFQYMNEVVIEAVDGPLDKRVEMRVTMNKWRNSCTR